MIFRKIFRKNPRILAVFSYRYDAHLVPDLLTNIENLVDGWISYDDRSADAIYSSEPTRQWALVEEARKVGASWVLAVDPDERFESRAKNKIPNLINADGAVVWTFQLREMYSENTYRIDGIWGNKRQARLFPLLEGQQPHFKQMHSSWPPPGPDYTVKHSEINLYHLKMIEPRRRIMRRDVYNALDPESALQAKGYNYLTDEAGAIFERIPSGREYHPSHKDDGGLWMPAATKLDPLPLKDPMEIIRRAKFLANCGDISGAVQEAEKAILIDPERPSLLRDYILLSLRRGTLIDISAAAKRLGASRTSKKIYRGLARACALLSKCGPVDLPSAICPDFSWTDLREAFAAVPPGTQARIQTPWFAPPVRVTPGPRVNSRSQFELSVVVIGVNAPSSLAAAVDSLLAQDQPSEIIVVNTGRGNLADCLGERSNHVILVECENRGFVGAARNLGVAASSGRYIAFLAGDCTAGAGWNQNRLAAHHNGARAVSGAVENPASDNPLAISRHYFLFPRRLPGAGRDRGTRFSLSYERQLFDQFGAFATGIRVGEDVEFNARLRAGHIHMEWNGDVVLFHNPPAGFLSVIREMFARGRRLERISKRKTTPSDRTSLSVELSRISDRLSRDTSTTVDGLRTKYSGKTLRRSLWCLDILAVSFGLGVYLGYAKKRRFEKAITRARRLIRQNKPDRAMGILIRQWKQGWRNETAELLLHAAEKSTATTEFDDILERSLLQPGRSATLLIVSAIRASERGDRRDAMSKLQASIMCGPSSHDWTLIGRFLVDAREPDNAAGSYLRAADMAPVSAIPGLVKQLRQVGADDAALRVLIYSAANNPNKKGLLDQLEAALDSK